MIKAFKEVLEIKKTTQTNDEIIDLTSTFLQQLQQQSSVQNIEAGEKQTEDEVNNKTTRFKRDDIMLITKELDELTTESDDIDDDTNSMLDAVSNLDSESDKSLTDFESDGDLNEDYVPSIYNIVKDFKYLKINWVTNLFILS